jgi:hypothetical protein
MPPLNSGVDLTGQRFGILTVVKRSGTKDYMSQWLCKCDCGQFHIVRINHLRGGQIKSCGCRSSRNRRGKDHGCWTGHEEMTGSFLSQWRHGAKSRNFKIEVEPKDLWAIYINQNRKCALTGLPIDFKAKKWFHGTASIDRIDSKKGYIAGNIQWVHTDINRMKLDYPQDYFIQMCRRVANIGGIWLDEQKGKI